MAQAKGGPCRDEVTFRFTMDELIALKNICRIAHEEANVNGVPRRFEVFFMNVENKKPGEFYQAQILGTEERGL